MSTVWTDLVGPRRFLRQIHDDLNEGACVLVVLPRGAPVGIVEAIERALIRHAPWHVRAIAPRDESALPPANAVLQKCGIRLAGAVHARTLAECEGFRNTIALVDGTNMNDPEPWLALISRYADIIRDTSPEQRGLLCLIVTGSAANLPSVGPGLRVRVWNGVVDTLDVKTMVRALWSVSASREFDVGEALREALIAELSCGDVTFAARLADVALGVLLEPHDLLVSYAARREWVAADEPHWRDGAVARVDGRRRIHPARLAIETDGRREILRHLWRAEVEVLFPFIEEERHITVSAWHDELTRSLARKAVVTETGKMLASPEQLELVHLIERLQGHSQGRERCAWLALLRDIRNDLAHLRPCETDRILRLVEVAAAMQAREGG